MLQFTNTSALITTMLLACLLAPIFCISGCTKHEIDDKKQAKELSRRLNDFSKPYDLDIDGINDSTRVWKDDNSGLQRALTPRKLDLDSEAATKSFVEKLLSHNPQTEALTIATMRSGEADNRVIELLNRFPKLRSLHIYSNYENYDVQALKNLNSLTELEITQRQVNDYGFLRGMTSLKSLSISTQNIKESDLKIISKLPNLKNLSISIYKPFKRSELDRIDFPKLQSLQIFGSGCNDDLCHWISNQKSLEYVNLSGHFNITDKGLCMLSQLPNLRILKIDCPIANGESIECLSTMKLDKLSINLKEITPQNLPLLSKLKNVSDLRLYSLQNMFKPNIDIFQYLYKLNNLRILVLGYNAPISKETCQLFGQMRSLELLYLPGLDHYSKELESLRKVNSSCFVRGSVDYCGYR